MISFAFKEKNFYDKQLLATKIMSVFSNCDVNIVVISIFSTTCISPERPTYEL